MVLCNCTVVSIGFVTTHSHGLVGRELSCRCRGCYLYYGVIRWWFVTTCVTGCSSHTVVMLYGVRVKVDTFCLPILICYPGVRVLDWCAEVWAKVVVLMSLCWFVCSCLLYSQSGFLLFLFIFFLTFPDVF